MRLLLHRDSMRGYQFVQIRKHDDTLYPHGECPEGLLAMNLSMTIGFSYFLGGTLKSQHVTGDDSPIQFTLSFNLV